jgi:hypothetical protein
MLGGSGEEHVGVAALNGVFEGGSLVIWGALDDLHITEGECFKERLVQVELSSHDLPGLVGANWCSLWWGDWLWLGVDWFWLLLGLDFLLLSGLLRCWLSLLLTEGHSINVDN